MISPFGPTAVRLAGRFPDIDAVITDLAGLLQAYLEAARRREAGLAFYGMLLLDDPVERLVMALTPALLERSADVDERRASFDGVRSGELVVNGRLASEWFADSPVTEPGLRQLAAEFMALCPALLVRSTAEAGRLATIRAHPRPLERIVLEPFVPPAARAAERGTRPYVLIWAADRPGGELAYHAFALAELHVDRAFVTADGAAPAGAGGRAYAPGDPDLGAALAAANCVVTVDPADPGAAVAFARRGYGVVAPRSSGADEYVRDVATYDVRAPRELYVAVSIALGRPASLRAVPVEPPRAPPLVPLPMPRADAPLVSVVIPTFNRRAQLPAALASLGAQTYPNLEAIVVNDGGANVDDIVAACPFARVHNLPRNGGMNHAMMAGLALARGTFVQFLSDDDRLFPDHVERLVAAMLAAGASVGHGNVMIRYEGQLENGAQVTTGYNVGVFTETATPSEALIATPIAGHALMWRRSVYDEIGPWRDDCALADQEIQLRAAQRYAFVWIDQVTAEWCIRGTDNFSSKVNAADEQKRIYDELHPVPGRPLLALQRERTVENIRRRPPGPVFGPTLTVGSAPPAGVPR